MSETQTWGQPAATDPAPQGPKWYGRRWVQLLAAGLVGLVLGAAGGTEGPSQADLDAAKAATVEAQQEAATAKTEAEASLAAERAKIVQAQQALAAREKKITGAEAAAKANSFDGADGKYIVGTDIKPGTYRAAASEGCYYARLSSLDDGDIIENNNTDGPVVVQIRAGDKAFQAKRCGMFTRIGA